MASSPFLAGRLSLDDCAYLTALSERVLVFDGATGTNLQLMDLSPEDFGGEHLAISQDAMVHIAIRTIDIEIPGGHMTFASNASLIQDDNVTI